MHQLDLIARYIKSEAPEMLSKIQIDHTISNFFLQDLACEEVSQIYCFITDTVRYISKGEKTDTNHEDTVVPTMTSSDRTKYNSRRAEYDPEMEKRSVKKRKKTSVRSLLTRRKIGINTNHRFKGKNVNRKNFITL